MRSFLSRFLVQKLWRKVIFVFVMQLKVLHKVQFKNWGYNSRQYCPFHVGIVHMSNKNNTLELKILPTVVLAAPCPTIMHIWRCPNFSHIKLILCVPERFLPSCEQKNGHFVCVSAYPVKEITNLQSKYTYKKFKMVCKGITFAHCLTHFCVSVYELKKSQPKKFSHNSSC